MKQYFSNESGIHCWNRVPPTEKRGRIQTSYVSVSILSENKKTFIFNRDEVRAIYTKGSGPGGQNKNKVETCVVLIHIPTNISVRIDGRSRINNEKEAWCILEQRIKELHENTEDDIKNSNRFDQIGYGKRGNKKRSYRVKDNIVIDHITNRKIQLKDILKGRIELLK